MGEQSWPHRDDQRGEDYRLSHLKPEKGESYESSFTRNPFRKMMWEFEQAILDGIWDSFLRGREIRHLDFACGTGRILSHFAGRASLSVGIDISPSMLATAKKVHRGSELIEADITQNDPLGHRSFNLITAFRFFPNAQPRLRTEALRSLIRHLAEDGYLVFNNHMNMGSLLFRLARCLHRGGDDGMSHREVCELVARNGLEIVATYGRGFVPVGEDHLYLPISLLQKAEILLAKCTGIRGLAVNVVYVCRRLKNSLSQG
ncbi:MAG TPA: class I SAM-dependent methyltransferase [Candidatus Aminicenantes bacterium]|nr:class I SAM-dependent methyltransferase [Candidatus Aminicenantes bacterium]